MGNARKADKWGGRRYFGEMRGGGLKKQNKINKKQQNLTEQWKSICQLVPSPVQVIYTQLHPHNPHPHLLTAHLCNAQAWSLPPACSLYGDAFFPTKPITLLIMDKMAPYTSDSHLPTLFPKPSAGRCSQALNEPHLPLQVPGLPLFLSGSPISHFSSPKPAHTCTTLCMHLP